MRLSAAFIFMRIVVIIVVVVAVAVAIAVVITIVVGWPAGTIITALIAARLWGWTT